ncbi:hypothetical protein [Flavobacterium chilense]|nr:hypothetical protein [Flavobacterium chilense]
MKTSLWLNIDPLKEKKPNYFFEVGDPKGASAAQVEAIQAAVKYGEQVGVKVNVRIVK